MGEIQRSIVRISFTMNNHYGEVTDNIDDENNRKEIDMISCGIIILLGNECEIIAGSEMLKRCSTGVFHLSFPTEGGLYGDDFVVASSVILGEHIVKFVVSAIELDNQYIRQARFETLPMRTSQNLYVSVFSIDNPPERSDIQPAYVVDATSQVVFFISCRFHEYAPFGSVVFDDGGHIVGVCYAYQSRTHTWTVCSLKKFLDHMLGEEEMQRISYVRGGAEIPWQEGDY